MNLELEFVAAACKLSEQEGIYVSGRKYVCVWWCGRGKGEGVLENLFDLKTLLVFLRPHTLDIFHIGKSFR